MRVHGVVKWFDIRHRCGLIGRLDGGADCMVRQSDMRGTALCLIAAGDLVVFGVFDSPRGPTARDVVRLAGRLPRPLVDTGQHSTS